MIKPLFLLLPLLMTLINERIITEGVLTIEQAQKKVFSSNVELLAIRSQIESSKATVGQAKAIPNPEAELEVEGFEANEIKVVISQTFELGGKRKSRITHAEKELDSKQLEYEQKVLELKTETIRRFLPLIALQEKSLLLDSMIAIVEKTEQTINKRIEIGASMSIDALRANMQLEEIQLEKKAMQREVEQKRLVLVALWTDSSFVFKTVEGSMNASCPLPTLGELFDSLMSQPMIRSLSIENQILQTELAEAKAEAFPDFTISGGYIRNKELNENVPLIAVAIEIPLFNRNKGAIIGKQHEISSNRFETKQAIIDAKTELEVLHSQIGLLDEEYAALKHSLLPKAQEVFDNLSEYYQRGSVSFLEVMEAQAGLIELSKKLIDRELERTLLLTDLMELTGITLPIIN